MVFNYGGQTAALTRQSARTGRGGPETTPPSRGSAAYVRSIRFDRICTVRGPVRDTRVGVHVSQLASVRIRVARRSYRNRYSHEVSPMTCRVVDEKYEIGCDDCATGPRRYEPRTGFESDPNRDLCGVP